MKDKWQKILTNRRSSKCKREGWCGIPTWEARSGFSVLRLSLEATLLLKTLHCECNMHEHRSWTDKELSKGKTAWPGGRSGHEVICINTDQTASSQLRDTLEGWSSPGKKEKNHSSKQSMCMLRNTDVLLSLNTQNPSIVMCGSNLVYWMSSFSLPVLAILENLSSATSGRCCPVQQ